MELDQLFRFVVHRDNYSLELGLCIKIGHLRNMLSRFEILQVRPDACEKLFVDVQLKLRQHMLVLVGKRIDGPHRVRIQLLL
mgnify:CR=1 FL=1